MPLINSLRNKFGAIITTLIAVAIVAFIIGDFIAGRQTGGGQFQESVIGFVNDKPISRTQFEGMVNQSRDSYTRSQGKAPTNSYMFSYRNSIWNQLVEEYLLNAEYDEIALMLTEEEVQDMITGDNIDEGLKQQFKDPETGEFDKEALLTTLENFKNAPASQRGNWYAYEKFLRDSKIRKKYETLFSQSVYVPDFIGKNKHIQDNQVAKVKYCYVPYYSVPDSLLNEPTNQELSNYLNENIKKYEQKKSRSFKYISIKKVPSSDDSLAFNREIKQLKEELTNAKEDSTFAMLNSESTENYYTRYDISKLPKKLQDQVKDLKEGQVIGPEQTGEKTILYKIAKISEGITRVAKASHILFKAKTKDDPKSEKEAENKAKKILNEIIAGTSFTEMAKKHGTDGTASSGGELGWGVEGKTWVKEFSEPIFKKTRKGLIKKVIKSQFGYHLIKVTELPTNKEFQVASIEKELVPSDQTLNNAYQVASDFLSTIDDLESFEEQAKMAEYEIKEAKKITTTTSQVSGIENSRSLIRWAFSSDTFLQSISDLEAGDFDDQYVIACIYQVIEEGNPELADVKEVVKTEVLKKKKAQYITQRLDSLSGNFEEIAGNYGKDASVQTKTGLKFTENSLPIVGQAPEVIGLIFSLEKDETTPPVAISNGVIILKLIDKSEVTEIADYSAIKKSEKDALVRNSKGNITNALKHFADIQDMRHLFY